MKITELLLADIGDREANMPIETRASKVLGHPQTVIAKIGRLSTVLLAAATLATSGYADEPSFGTTTPRHPKQGPTIYAPVSTYVSNGLIAYTVPSERDENGLSFNFPLNQLKQISSEISQTHEFFNAYPSKIRDSDYNAPKEWVLLFKKINPEPLPGRDVPSGASTNTKPLLPIVPGNN